MSHVGQEIRRIREERGLNQTQLAFLVGTGPAAISRIENGRQSPNTETLERIARALEAEVASLFPKAQTPLFREQPSGEDAEHGQSAAILENPSEIPQGEFLRALSVATSDEALLDIFYRTDAERTHLELEFREDESNRSARDAFARAVERRMIVFLTLVERGVAPHDSESVRLAEQLQEVLQGS